MIYGTHTRNSSILSIRIDKRLVVKGELYMFIAMSALVNFSLLPASSLYVFDVVNVAVYVTCMKQCRRVFSEIKWLLTLVDVFLIYCLISAVCSLTAPQYVIWELNAVLRVFIFLSIWSAVCGLDDLSGFLSVLYKAQIVNFLFASCQFFVLGLQGDNCGGLFGIISGCNAYTNIYLSVVCGYAMSSYLSRRRVKIAGLILTCVMSFCVATFSEIKFFYFEFVIILISSLWMNRFSVKTAVLTVLGLAALVAGLQFLAIYYPDSYELLFDAEALEAYDDGSQVATSGYGISRSTPIPQIDELFFRDDDIERVFGFGFGSATMSSIGFFATPFYNVYGYLRYYYSPVAMIYLQLGWLGIILYFFIFIAIAVYTLRLKNVFRGVAPELYGFAISMVLIFIANCFYNGTARSAAALLWAVVLSAPVLASKLRNTSEKVLTK